VADGDGDALEPGTKPATGPGKPLPPELDDGDGVADAVGDGEDDGVWADAADANIMSTPVIKHMAASTATARERISLRMGSPFVPYGLPTTKGPMREMRGFLEGSLEGRTNDLRQQEVGDFFQLSF
jgi:hypothetical protein